MCVLVRVGAWMRGCVGVGGGVGSRLPHKKALFVGQICASTLDLLTREMLGDWTRRRLASNDTADIQSVACRE